MVSYQLSPLGHPVLVYNFDSDLEERRRDGVKSHVQPETHM